MKPVIAELDSIGLLALVGERQLDDLEVLQVLRSPFCTVQIAELIAADPKLLDAHAIRERLAGFPGFSFSRALDMLSTLPWASLLSLSQTPRTPPVVRRQAERKVLSQIVSMTLGEKIALARRAHRAILPTLISGGDGQVLSALLDNPRLVENDILVMLNTAEPPPEFFAELARHRKWGQYLRVRRAIVECPHSPLPLALSVLVQLPTSELRRVIARPDLPEKVRDAARLLLEREARGRRGVVESSIDVGNGGAAQPPEGLR